MKPFEEQDIVEKLRIRAEIRRKIGRGSGERDRIADLCDDAANEIDRLRAEIQRMQGFRSPAFTVEAIAAKFDEALKKKV